MWNDNEVTIYAKKKELTRNNKPRWVWVANVGGKEIKALSLRMCKVLVAETREQMARGNFSWIEGI